MAVTDRTPPAHGDGRLEIGQADEHPGYAVERVGHAFDGGMIDTVPDNPLLYR
ncbi:MAG: hypothetical protein OXI95_15900 [bacterium]|nr:hypothetical protein [bacterium]